MKKELTKVMMVEIQSNQEKVQQNFKSEVHVSRLSARIDSDEKLEVRIFDDITRLNQGLLMRMLPVRDKLTVMEHKDLRILIATLLLVRGTCTIYLYAKEGTTAILECPMRVPVDNITWRGPPNLKTYVSGNQKAEFEHIRFIHTSQNNHHTLHILDFTTENEGLYRCSSLGGMDTFNVTMFPSGGIPDNYSYEWEHRTNADDPLRYFSSKPTIAIRLDFQNNGIYICRDSSSIGTTHKTGCQSSEYNLSVSTPPQFVSSNTDERYFDHYRLNELKLQYIADPDANYSVLKDNRAIPIEELNLNNINISVIDARIQQSIYDKLVYINGFDMYIRIYVANTLDFNNITIVLYNNIGYVNHTIEVKSAVAELKDQIAENKMFLAIIATTSLLFSVAVAFWFKLIHEDDSNYGASTTHTRQTEPQASFTNDIYGDELNYIEVAFDLRPNPQSHRLYCDDRTPYADVDLTIKVDPLPDSDSDSEVDENSQS
ncbi:Hypothetical predicted protein [Mytilus galloprovincialis]|nr:Hypothetical predicted protein [Mytilus galloprovincialis]